jgi:predicted transcriptional regulator
MPADLWRPDLYVVARFLERFWRTRRPHGKTDLQVAVRLNYTVFRRYLDWLVAKGLLHLAPGADGMEQVTITEKGLATYSRLVTWIHETVGRP